MNTTILRPRYDNTTTADAFHPPKWKRLLTAFLLTALFLLSLSGCAENNSDEPEGASGNTSASGHYTEEDMELPLQDGEDVLNLTSTEDGSPILFALAEDNQIQRYEYTGQEWERTSLDWFGQIYTDQTVSPMEVQETGGGTQFVRGMDEEGRFHIARGQEGEPGEELQIPYLTQQSELGYPFITGFFVDGKGNYWLEAFYESKIVVAAGDTLETLQEIDTVQSFSMSQRLAFHGDGMIAVMTGDDTFTFYDEAREKQGEISLKISMEEAGQLVMCSDQENWYYFSQAGIIRFGLGNEIQEIIMDGGMGAMGSAVNSVMGAVQGKENDFYTLYRQDKAGTFSLKHYVYDSGAAADPEQTLQVFGLTDSDTVREAAIGFQKTHPDVKVEFTTSGKELGEVTSDDIRTLNTELLSGNGADVLLLDGLPMDAYIEKGILEDLTGTVEELMGEDSYLENILKNTAQAGGKVYGLPVKFYVPILFGNEDAKQALTSMETLEAFLEQNPEASVFGIADRFYIRDFLFQLYREEIFDKEGKVDQEKLAALLELENKIAANAKANLFDEELSNQDGAGGYTRDPFSNLCMEGILNHPEGAATASISSLPDMMIPYTLMRQQGLAPAAVQELYVPRSIVGINRNTSQSGTAREFVKYLFSKEVQSAQLDDGFPVLESALQAKKNELESEYASSFSFMSSGNIDGEEFLLEATFPTMEEVDAFIGLCKTLTEPAVQERIIWNLYQEEADQYMGGNIDARTAAQNIAQKVDTYLAE